MNDESRFLDKQLIKVLTCIYCIVIMANLYQAQLQPYKLKPLPDSALRWTPDEKEPLFELLKTLQIF